VLQAFHREAPNLFLGAAFVTAGLVAIAFSALREKRDQLLLYFGIFAGLCVPFDLLYAAARSH
jgi:uncharacterized membrane protein